MHFLSKNNSTSYSGVSFVWLAIYILLVHENCFIENLVANLKNVGNVMFMKKYRNV